MKSYPGIGYKISPKKFGNKNLSTVASNPWMLKTNNLKTIPAEKGYFDTVLHTFAIEMGKTHGCNTS